MYIFKILKIFICTVLFFSLISCNDFLTETPQGEISTGQFFQTPGEARSFIDRLYRVGAAADFYDSINSLDQDPAGLSNMMSGYYQSAEARVSILNILRLQLGPEVANEFFTDYWADLYDAIAQANIALKEIPDRPIPDEQKLNMLSEARFFRALNYFELVKAFGDVPLVVEPFEAVNDDIFTARTNSEAVYNQIFEDLNWVINQGNLPQTTFAGNNFRLVEDIALTVLADAYLQSAGFPLQLTDNYARAAEAARTVIQNGFHELVQHGPNVADNPVAESAYNIMRTSDTEKEYIYSIEFDGTIDPNGHANTAIPRQDGPRDQIRFNNTFNKYGPRQQLLDLYNEDEDLRVQNQQMFYTSFEHEGEVIELSEPAPWWFFERSAIFETGRGTQDIKAYRFAEVLLIAAEAIARTEGVTPEAVDYLADVRDRALWQTDRSVIESELLVLSEPDFVEEVWKEKVREFPFEFKLWENIQRTRQFPTPSQSTPGEIEYIDVVGAPTPNPQDALTFQEFHLLFPIGQDIIEKNPALKQNPGY